MGTATPRGILLKSWVRSVSNACSGARSARTLWSWGDRDGCLQNPNELTSFLPPGNGAQRPGPCKIIWPALAKREIGFAPQFPTSDSHRPGQLLRNEAQQLSRPLCWCHFKVVFPLVHSCAQWRRHIPRHGLLLLPKPSWNISSFPPPQLLRYLSSL